MMPNVLYLPASKSGSADLLLYFNDGDSIQFQWKMGDQTVTQTTVRDESQKVRACPSLIEKEV